MSEELVNIYKQQANEEDEELYDVETMALNKSNLNMYIHSPIFRSKLPSKYIFLVHSDDVSNFSLCAKGEDFNFTVITYNQERYALHYEDVVGKHAERRFRLCRNYSLKLEEGKFTINLQNILMEDIKSKQINLISQSNISWKLHNYTYLRRNLKISNNTKLSVKLTSTQNSCISFYVCLHKNSTLHVKIDYDNSLVAHETIKSTSANTFEIKTWQYVKIPLNKSAEMIEIIFEVTSNKGNNDFWAIDTEHVYSCNDFEVVQYTLNETDSSEPICKTFEQDTKHQYNFDKKGFLSDNISCKDVFKNFPNCVRHKIYTGNLSFCPWGYKGNYCNETCQSGYFGIDCKDYFEINITAINHNSLNITWDQKITNNFDNFTVTYWSTSQQPKEKILQRQNVNIKINQSYELIENLQPSTNYTIEFYNKTKYAVTKDNATNSPNQTENKTNTLNKKYDIALGAVLSTLCIIFIIALMMIYHLFKKAYKITPTDEFMLLKEVSSRESNSSEKIKISTKIKVDELDHYIIQCLEEIAETNHIKEQYFSTPERFKNETTVHGETTKNLLKNRFKNLLPYDSTRVVLNNSENNYINANYIDGFESPKAFIATQAPKYETLNDFWLMVCQQDVTTILMMTELMEGFKIKCQKYWPDLQQIECFDKIIVQTIKEHYFSDYVERDFEVVYDNRKKIVRQLQFISWPDHEIPVNARSLIQFVQKVQMLSLDRRIVVHCNAGCGTTGTIIMIHIALRMASKCGVIDFGQILFNLRCQRVKMVNSLEQYIFAHLFVFEYLNIRDFSVPVTENYDFFHSAIKGISTFSLFNDITKITRIYATVNNSQINNFYNGVFIDGLQHPLRFLVLQQPKANDINDFWQIIREHKINTVVSLDVTQKSSKFWPISKEDGDKTIGSTFSLNFEENRSRDFLDRVKIKVTEEEESESVNIIDVKSLINSADDYLEVWKEMFNFGYNNTAPILVTCSDGYTRSGLFVALAYMLEMINMDKICDVFSAIRIVSQGRKEFVFEKFHIDLLHQAALKYVKELYKL